MLEQVLIIAASMAVISGGLAALWRWALRPLSRGISQTAHFFEDWFGESDRPGRPGSRGVMERLDSVEHKATRAEWHAGNGARVAMRTIVEGLATDVAAIRASQGELEGRYEDLERTVTEEHRVGPPRQ